MRRGEGAIESDGVAQRLVRLQVLFLARLYGAQRVGEDGIGWCDGGGVGEQDLGGGDVACCYECRGQR